MQQKQGQTVHRTIQQTHKQSGKIGICGHNFDVEAQMYQTILYYIKTELHKL